MFIVFFEMDKMKKRGVANMYSTCYSSKTYNRLKRKYKTCLATFFYLSLVWNFNREKNSAFPGLFLIIIYIFQYYFHSGRNTTERGKLK